MFLTGKCLWFIPRETIQHVLVCREGVIDGGMLNIAVNGIEDPSWNSGQSHLFHVNAPRKGMNLSVLPPAMCKQQGRLGSFALVRQPV